MKQLRLYPVVARQGQDLSKVKKTVVPAQSMTLKEILRRFVKRESLPQAKDGIYEDRYPYDLEKLAKADRVEQDEVIEELRSEGSRIKVKLAAEEQVKADIAKAEKEMDRQKWLEELKQSDPNPKQP